MIFARNLKACRKAFTLPWKGFNTDQEKVLASVSSAMAIVGEIVALSVGSCSLQQTAWVACRCFLHLVLCGWFVYKC